LAYTEPEHEGNLSLAEIFYSPGDLGSRWPVLKVPIERNFQRT